MPRRRPVHRFTRSIRFGSWAVLLAGLLATRIASAVGADPVHNTDTGLDYPTIQAAIDAAGTLDGHHIVVDAGTYSENVTLGKSLTLSGAQAGNTACGRVTGAPDPATESIITGAGNLLTLVTGCAGSTIDGFSFSGGAISITSTSGPLNDVTIKNNHLGGFTTAATFLNDSGRDLTLDANNSDGSSKTGAGGTHHFDTDTFDGLWVINNCVHDGSGTGMFVDGDNNVRPSANRRPQIDGNRFENQTTNVGLNLGSRAFTTGDIKNNVIKSNAFDGIQGGIRNSQITGNRFEDNGRWGLALTSFGNTTAARGAFNDTITGNTFTANDSAGLFISAAMFAGHAGSNHANFNDIVGNGAGGAGYGVIYRGSETIDVGCNWWGDIDGPDYPPANPNPPGDGLFAPSAIFAPWLDGSITGSPNCNQSPPVSTTTSLTSDVNPSSCGQKVNLIATVSPNTATGTVEFFDGATSLGTAPVTAGVATLSTTFSTTGDHSLTASYSGDGDHNPSASNAYVQHVDPLSTTTTLATDPVKSFWGDKVTLTATVTPNDATGTVDFLEVTTGKTGLFPGDPVPANPHFFDLRPVTLGVKFFADVPGVVNAIRFYKDANNSGPHTVELWSGTGQLLASAPSAGETASGWQTAPLSAPVAIQANTVYIAAYHTESGYPQDQFYFTSQLDSPPLHAPAESPGNPNGVYVYAAAGNFPTNGINASNYYVDLAFAATQTLGSGPVSGGQATLSISTLEVGVHTLVAAYGGDVCHSASASAKTDHEVNRATPTVLLESDNQPAERNEKIEFTATLAPSDATGSVEFFDGASSLGTSPVTAGVATISVSNLPAGSHSITAVYGGDAHYTMATSNKLKQDVDLIPTTTSLTSVPNPSDCGEKVVFTATVDPSGGTGTVEFFDGATSLGNGTPTGPGTYELSTSSLSAGVTHSITTTYSGDGKYAGSTSDPLLQQVDKLPTTVVLESSDPDIKEGNKIMLTATITPAAATGSVEFKDGTTSLGTAPVTGGTATLSVSTLDPGSHLLTAEYSGDDCYQARVSDPIKQDIQVDDAPIVTVTSPNGGENWAVNTTQKISWTVDEDNTVTSVDLYLSRDNGSTYEHITHIIGDPDTYMWTVTGPGTNTDATPVYSALWKVVATDDANQDGEDVSDAPFSIFDIATPTLLSTFLAEPTAAGIELRWSFALPDELRDVTLERADRLDGVWMRIDAETRREGELTVALDRSTTPGRTYYYRLVAFRLSGQRLVFGPLAGTAGAALTEFALAPARPNPSRGPTSIEFVAPREARLRLAVVDVQGRELAKLADGVYHAGRHLVAWDGTDGRGPVPMGLYFVRLSVNGRTFTQRLVLAR